jgi:hypothetical protein
MHSNSYQSLRLFSCQMKLLTHTHIWWTSTSAQQSYDTYSGLQHQLNKAMGGISTRFHHIREDRW